MTIVNLNNPVLNALSAISASLPLTMSAAYKFGLNIDTSTLGIDSNALTWPWSVYRPLRIPNGEKKIKLDYDTNWFTTNGSGLTLYAGSNHLQITDTGFINLLTDNTLQWTTTNGNDVLGTNLSSSHLNINGGAINLIINENTLEWTGA